MVDEGKCDRARIDDWLSRNVSRHDGYRRLLASLPSILDEVARLPPATSSILRMHAKRTAVGMRDMVAACSAGLTSVGELRQYCYVVAGIVGELLTALFLQDAPALTRVGHDLVAEERRFGEGLQLVNILKDASADAAEGRTFLPSRVTPAEVRALAAEDLQGARRYIAALQRGGAPASFVAFTSFPCELAEETLDALRTHGPGAKVPRARVMELFLRYKALSARS